MGAAYGKKKSYSVDQEPPAKQPSLKNRPHPDRDLEQPWSEGVHRKLSPVSPRADYIEGDGDEDGDKDEDIIKPRKLLNPVKDSKRHQEVHRELLRRGGPGVETKPELQRVLESRKRDQLMRQRRQEDEARRKVSPLEAELMKRHRKLEELERQQQQEDEDNLKAPEFVKVKEKLRRTSFHSKEQEDRSIGHSEDILRTPRGHSEETERTLRGLNSWTPPVRD
ncbi:protein FAM107B-like [Mugil cephalus]|uniref:protein FAM107B-like n=1 Tax=Mugil cephalus TaxID=48193 RepID=UPI001FB83AFE|nr:protein FAM107B-like [Mugil cephalus]